MGITTIDPGQPIDYADSSKIPTTYICGACKKSRIKLWRTLRYHLQHMVLRCADCVSAETGVNISSMKLDGHYTHESGRVTSNIGGYVPAIPTLANDNFWRYQTIPPQALAWWIRLSVR